MNIAQIGNFSAPFSTENELLKALKQLGHNVATFDESQPKAFRFDPAKYEAVIWTHTQGFNKQNAHVEQRELLRKALKVNIPTVQYHLDRWWGLSREHLVHEEPAFDCDIVCTADGGHQEEWESIGVDHRWFPPAVSEFECVPGTFREEYAADIAFIGGWQQYGHPEAKHRPALVQWLQENYGDRVKFWPEPGQPAIREEKLRDVIASTKIIVGDSCIVDWENECCYWSDRIPETLGRGGFLIHPWVSGMEQQFSDGGLTFGNWPAWDWDALKSQLNFYLDSAMDENRQLMAKAGQEYVTENHTYTVRMKQLIELMQQDGLL